MAAALRKFSCSTFRQIVRCTRSFSSQSGLTQKSNVWKICGCAFGGITSLYIINETRKGWSNFSVMAKEQAIPTKAERRAAYVQTQREVRFLSFASIEFEGNVYMSPQDFLESVTEEIPRARAGRHHLDRRDVEKVLKKTPRRSRGSNHMFRDLNENGLISYTEYLFLLCVLTKSRSGFRIAFNMFDTDGNQRVDKQEFLVLERVMLGTRGESKSADGLESIITSHKTTSDHRLTSMLETKKLKVGDKSHNTSPSESPSNAHQLFHQSSPSPLTSHTDGSMGAPLADTTLGVHFFGHKGKDVLRYEDFHRFMDDLQSEVLEIEFVEFSHGMATITEEEFAKILLRYTILSQDDIEDYLLRLRQRIPQSKGITFKDFKEFGQFLNNLDDFALAMRIYTFADNSISESDFQRAVKAVTGLSLSPHLIHVVFQLFDIDGDGKLSHREFISVMKDRLHRGFRSSLVRESKWEEFKSCVKREIKHA